MRISIIVVEHSLRRLISNARKKECIGQIMFEGKVFSQICEALSNEKYPIIYEKEKHELFSNWFVSNIEFANVDVYQGRHPDIVITENKHIEGYELKSAKNRNADVQYNSTPPCGTMLYQGTKIKCFYIFADYHLDNSQTQGFLQRI